MKTLLDICLLEDLNVSRGRVVVIAIENCNALSSATDMFLQSELKSWKITEI